MTDEPIGLPTASAGQLRSARRLLQRKQRDRLGRFLVDGPQAVRECLASCDQVLVTPDAAIRHADLVDRARRSGVPVLVSAEVDRLSDSVTPQGIVAVHRTIGVGLDDVFADSARLVVIAARVRDPGNAGTIIRCADAFGADGVVLTTDSVDLHNQKTVRASVGSMFHLPVATGVPLADAVAGCHRAGMTVLAADGTGEADVDDLRDDGGLSGPVAWLLGNEAWGLPEADRALADRVVRVPMWGRAESLNLSTAAAVCLYATSSAQRR